MVDRQPVQEVRNQIVADIPSLDLVRHDLEIAIADPPWYPEDLANWAAIGARALGPGSVVLVSVWPPDTRPGAEADLSKALADISRWAEITDPGIVLGYKAPHFEEVAAANSPDGSLATSPRRGRLLRLKVRSTPPRPAVALSTSVWQRFFLDSYQLAVKITPSTSGPSLVVPHPQANGWFWPFVSARAPGRDRIGIWSSEGEVGLVTDPAQLIAALKNAFATDNAAAFEASLAAAPEMIKWKLPRPPYQRILEWKHQ
ncbi:hypothetical protein [Azospirillum aestuarii]|uniref:hypothetical protein n=1 Tax=Azospirillum aestuarii TaxID=2802052 RepID=UPI00405512CE